MYVTKFAEVIYPFFYQVFTIEEMLPHVKDLPGLVCKNLFMYDKKTKGLWLLSVRHEVEIKLPDLSKKVGARGGLRFAADDILFETLGVRQGCVTPFALINDLDHKVKFLLDEELLNENHEKLHFHPMVNSATMGIRPADFKKFVEAVGHEPVSVKFDQP